MTIDEIKAAVDAGHSVHWANEGYVVHRDCAGQYLITFRHNGSTVGLTDRASTKLNGDPQLFFVSRPDLGVTMHCETCQSDEVKQQSWAAWSTELQSWQVDHLDDTVFCNRCHQATRLISRPIRDYGEGKSGTGQASQATPAPGAGQGEKGESELSGG